jgi:tRNA (guanine37-N1)-methyltransferase
VKFVIVTLFPEMFTALNYGITGRAIKKKLITLKYYNPRDFSKDKHRHVDDKPYGGGPGMVMLAQPLYDAIEKAKIFCRSKTKVIYLTPQGQLLDQTKAKLLAREKNLILLAGRYEGIDERVIETKVDEELSIGNYVLSGGELAAMVMIDAIVRLLPGALGDEDSAKQDSFMQSLLDYPQYTKPKIFNGQKVPNVLLSGNHKRIAYWRLKQALGRTYLRRPNLLKKRHLTKDEENLLSEFINEQKSRDKP